MAEAAAPPCLVTVTRDEVVESVHRGDVAVVRASGEVLCAWGSADRVVYPRSALKPFQALAGLEQLHAAGLGLPEVGLALACASHTGTSEHQVEAACVLATAGLDESALQCPPDWPADGAARCQQDVPTRLAHNCSGKHAAFLYAHTAAGGDPDRYLDVGTPLQQRVRRLLTEVSGSEPAGPGIDGCGAPAWRVSLRGLATAFARLAGAGEPDPLAVRLAPVRAAMTARPDLVGDAHTPDSLLMAADGRLVAKRGAEGVLAAGFFGADGAVGVAVKVADGSARAATAPLAAVLHRLGAHVPEDLRRTAVLGGGQPHGSVAAVPEFDEHVEACADACRR